MRTFPGWSLTFDEVPPTSSMRLLARITGVDLKRVPPKSRPAAPCKGFPAHGDGPQGLRRPRFSFFRFTCQTARDRVAPLSRSRERSKFLASDRNRTPGPRMKRVSVRSFAGAQKHRGEPRTVNRLYRPRGRTLSTLPRRVPENLCARLSSGKQRHPAAHHEPQPRAKLRRLRYFSRWWRTRAMQAPGSSAALKPHSCDLLAQWGCRNAARTKSGVCAR
jgi:hypothetical protein